MPASRQDGDGGMLNSVVPAYPVYQSNVRHATILAGRPGTCSAQIHPSMGRSVYRTASGVAMVHDAWDGFPP